MINGEPWSLAHLPSERTEPTTVRPDRNDVPANPRFFASSGCYRLGIDVWRSVLGGGLAGAR